ncbi:MAG TPA: PilZ domain-containing protein [Desulfobacterales bacterium]|nr:PilZ domain-containing protein [Desulfobacterales bacterium]
MERMYAGATNHVTVICPKCGLKKNINVFKYKDTHKRLKAKCKCGEIFRLSLEFRRFYRKIVRLTGEYFAQEKDEKGEVLIKDISMTGINFEASKPHNIAKDDAVEVKFTLDNPDKTELDTLVKIMWAKGLNVGGHFIDQVRYKQDLVLYLTT